MSTTVVRPNLIGGSWLEEGGDGRIDVTDPADRATGPLRERSEQVAVDLVHETRVKTVATRAG